MGSSFWHWPLDWTLHDVGRFARMLEFFDHTADVGVRVTATSLEALFVEAALGLTTTVTDPTRLGRSTTRHVSLGASDLDQLLVDWLTELVGLFDIEQFLARSARVSVRGDDPGNPGWHLEATATGERFDPSRHRLKVLVKGVTYHGLGIERTADGHWRSDIVFDI